MTMQWQKLCATQSPGIQSVVLGLTGLRACAKQSIEMYVPHRTRISNAIRHSHPREIGAKITVPLNSLEGLKDRGQSGYRSDLGSNAFAAQIG